MKKTLFLIILVVSLIQINVSAQFTLILNISYPAPTYLFDWNTTKAGLMTVILSSSSLNNITVKFRTQLQKSDGVTIATSNIASASIHTIKNGTNTFSLAHALQLENLQFTDGSIIKSIQTSGKLPAGSYQICIEMLNSENNAELTKAPVCRPFTQANYQLPYLLTPNDKTWLDANLAQTVISFRWSSVVPQMMEQVIYRLQVFEVMDGQEPVQALLSNQPILNTDIRNTTQYFWRPQLSLKDSIGHIFIWTVQTLDSEGFPVTSIDDNNQARSEPRVFGVCNKLKHEKEDIGEDCAAGRKL